MRDKISIASAIHDRATAERYLLPSLEALDADTVTPILLDNPGNVLGRNLGRLFNILRRIDGPRVRAFLHADVTFDASFADDVLRAVDRLEADGLAWGALGAVGRSWEGAYVWGHEVSEPVPVCALDSCCLVLDTRREIAFDDRTFDGVHCHVEDYCLQCHAAGLGVYVVPMRFEHVGATYAVMGSQWGDYPKYRKRLDKKWRKRFGSIATT